MEEDLVRVVARASVDDAFRERLTRAPDDALRGYRLTEADREALSTPGPHWARLLGRAARALGIGADAWEPESPPPGSDPKVLEVAVSPQPGSDPKVLEVARAGDRPASPLDGLPPVALQLRLAPGQRPDGSTAWSISLVPPGQALPPPVPGESRPWLRVAAADGHVSAWIAPEAAPEGGPPAVEGPRWAHRTDAVAARAAATARRVPAPERRDAVRQALDVVRGARTEPLTPWGLTPPGETSEPLTPWGLTPSGETSVGGRITVVGLGVQGTEEITRAAEREVRRASVVFSVDTSPGVRAFLQARCPRVVPLFERAYRTRSGRLPTYVDIAADVVDAALDGEPVVLAVQGHPTQFSYVPVLLRDAGPLFGLDVTVQPGISTLAGLLARLGLDPGDHGLQTFEATDLLLRRRPVSPDLLTVIWQVGTLETRLHTGRPSRPERLHGLVRWLCTFFPEDQSVTVVGLPMHPGLPPRVWTVPLHALPDEAPALSAVTTLVIPPVGRRALADPWLAAAIDDPDHLARITHDGS